MKRGPTVPPAGRRGPFSLKTFFFKPFLASGVVQMGPDSRFGSFDFCFGPNGRFWTHFKPNLMFLERTGTLVNQDWTWAEAWADLGLRPTLDDLGLRLGPILDQPWADFWMTF